MPCFTSGPCQVRSSAGLKAKYQASEALIDDGPKLPRPCVGRVDRALIADLGREAEPHRQMPAIRRTHARANVVAYPLHAVAVLRAGEDVEADLPTSR